MEEQLGKISNAYFGLGGYQGAMIGLHLQFKADGCGVGTDISFWDYEAVKWSSNCKWSEAERDDQCAKVVRRVSKLLSDAKVKSVDKLIGVPVKLTFEGMTLKDFRILTEVL